MEVALSHIDTSALQTKSSFRLKRRLFSPYTSMEIITAIAMVSVLAFIAALNILPGQYKARRAMALQDVSILSEAIEAYKVSNTHYPSMEEGLTVLENALADKSDPWGNAYQYFYSARTGQFNVYSFGNDGKAGGIGKAQDIGMPPPTQEALNNSK
ncbi:MAG: type II secretion system protein GspG [Robiginitomaculum sp.]|nr:type II secretion system protein GspG [Robiginitomaculum sp.]MDQ7078271.1 type II secretion system protein GspG [Robiginitomaculum sp.]